MATYTKLSADEIREAALIEAKKQFLTVGIRNTKIGDIAKAIGVGRSTLYRYYEEKEQLAFIVLYDILLNDILETCYNKTLDEHLNGFDQLTAFFDYYVTLLNENAPFLSFISEFDRLFEKEYPDYPEVEKFKIGMGYTWVIPAQFIEKGLKDGSISTSKSPKLLANIIINTALGIAQRTMPRNEHYEEEQGFSGMTILKETLDMLFDNIRAK